MLPGFCAAGWWLPIPPSFPSVLSQIFLHYAAWRLIRRQPGRSFSSTAVPIFGTLLSILVLGEAFHLYHAVGDGNGSGRHLDGGNPSGASSKSPDDRPA